jgi:lipid-A-disaccharide synthase
MKNILVIAAENSAENYAVQVVEEFRKNNSAVHFFGVGGDKMAQKGVELIVHNKELAVVGIIEVVSSIIKLKRYMKLLFKTAVERNADAVLLIDYPDFNLRMARKFKKYGIRVYYYISPTVWAWRYSRVNIIKKYVDHLFIIFPFEISIYEKENIPFTYTGHPLLPMIKVTQSKDDCRREWDIPRGKKLVALLPGSRKSEINFLLPEMLKAVEMLGKEFDIDVCLLKADSIEKEMIDSFLESSGVKVRVIEQQQGYNLINASDIVLTTCGTSNLEIAVIGVPFTAVYRVNKLSYLLGKRFVKINLYSIVNILSGREIIKELIQQDFTAEKMVAEMRRILTSREVRDEMQRRFEGLRKILSQEHHPPEIIYNKITSDLEVLKSSMHRY